MKLAILPARETRGKATIEQSKNQIVRVEERREKDGYLAFNQLGHWTLVEGRDNFCCKGKFDMLSVFVVAIVVEKLPSVLMGADGFGWGWGVGGGGINPISQPIFGLNPSPTESSNEEKGVKYAIFGGGTALKGQ